MAIGLSNYMSKLVGTFSSLCHAILPMRHSLASAEFVCHLICQKQFHFSVTLNLLHTHDIFLFSRNNLSNVP